MNDLSDFKPKGKGEKLVSSHNNKTQTKRIVKRARTGPPKGPDEMKLKSVNFPITMIADLQAVVDASGDFESDSDFIRQCCKPVIEEYKREHGLK